MPVTVRCPCCSTSLTAPDELVGTSARCEDCGQTFVVRRPKAKAASGDSTYPYRYGGLEAKEPDDRADDDRPRRRRRPARRSNTAAVLVAAAAVFGLLLVMVAGAGYWVLATRKPEPDPRARFVMPPRVVAGPVFQPQDAPLLPLPNDFAPPRMPGPPGFGPGSFTLSNPQWGGGFGDFRVDYAFAGNQPPIGMGFLRLVFQGPTGDRGTADLHVFEPRGTLSIHVLGPMRQRGGPITMWVEQGGFPGPFGQPGTKISNTVTLN